LHANSSADVPARLEALGLLGGVPRAALHAQIAAALRVVIQVRATAQGRVVDEVCVLRLDPGTRLVTATPAWRREFGAGPGALDLAELLACREVPPPAVLRRSAS
jgi:pilus assembly protein CpaF